jgi:hypothetical protein
MSKVATLFIGAGILSVGLYVGAYLKEQQLYGIAGANIVGTAALSARLHTVVLTALREGRTDKALKTLESYLQVQEALLESCSESICKAAAEREVQEAKLLVKSYRDRFPESVTHNQ